MELTELTLEEYYEHADAYDGYCRICKANTREGGTEPDAENYECPDCEGRTCMGIEQAVIEGRIAITE